MLTALGGAYKGNLSYLPSDTCIVHTIMQEYGYGAGAVPVPRGAPQKISDLLKKSPGGGKENIRISWIHMYMYGVQKFDDFVRSHDYWDTR